MPHEEVVAVERAGTQPEQLVRADRSRLDVVEVLEYWRNPRLGQAAAAGMSTTEAYRLLVTDGGGDVYEVSIRQYGRSHATAWHMRRVGSLWVRCGLARTSGASS